MSVLNFKTGSDGMLTNFTSGHVQHYQFYACYLDCELKLRKNKPRYLIIAFNPISSFTGFYPFFDGYLSIIRCSLFCQLEKAIYFWKWLHFVSHSMACWAELMNFLRTTRSRGATWLSSQCRIPADKWSNRTREIVARSENSQLLNNRQNSKLFYTVEYLIQPNSG